MRLREFAAALVLVCAGAPAPGQEGHWDGHLHFRGDAWPFRLDVARLADSVQATLDLPELGMAWQPVPVQMRGDSLVVELPFGLGAIPAVAEDDVLRGGRPTASGDTIRLRASRGTPFGMLREDVTFTNGAATLHGVFVRPVTDGPFPAVVLVHGSAAQGRGSWGYRSAADFFVRRGYAVLYYDKRGVGASTGDWMRSSFPDLEELAGDLRAAVAWLQERPELNGQVGLYGGSQALWVSARAAAPGGIAFLIMRGAPAVTPEQQELQRVRHTLEASGAADSVVRKALEHTRLYFSVVRSGSGWDALVRSVALVRTTPWGEELLQADTPDDLYWWRRNHAFDAEPDLRGIRAPVLLLYGENDTVVPPGENARRLAALLEHAPVTTLVFPRANHALELPSGPDDEGRWRFPRKATGSFDAIDAWLRGLRHRPAN